MKDKEFKVCTTEGKSFVAAGSRTILEQALDSGLVFDYSCKSGQCGVCKTVLTKGTVDVIGDPLALGELSPSTEILTCCSVATSDIVITASDLSQLHGITPAVFPARISSLELMTDDVLRVELRLPPSARFRFLEGQYIDVIGPSGEKRSYSIASGGRVGNIVLLIKRVAGGMLSNYWFNEASENDLLRLEGPKGTFFVREFGRPIVFLATGTGIAPVIAMLNCLTEAPSPPPSVMIFWGNRFESDFFWEPLGSKLHLDYMKVVSRPRDGSSGSLKYVQDVALNILDRPLSSYSVYACGSNEMIVDAKQKFLANGLSESKFYSDAFVQSF